MWGIWLNLNLKADKRKNEGDDDNDAIINTIDGEDEDGDPDSIEII